MLFILVSLYIFLLLIYSFILLTNVKLNKIYNNSISNKKINISSIFINQIINNSMLVKIKKNKIYKPLLIKKNNNTINYIFNNNDIILKSNLNSISYNFNRNKNEYYSLNIKFKKELFVIRKLKKYTEIYYSDKKIRLIGRKFKIKTKIFRNNYIILNILLYDNMLLYCNNINYNNDNSIINYVNNISFKHFNFNLKKFNISVNNTKYNYINQIIKKSFNEFKCNRINKNISFFDYLNSIKIIELKEFYQFEFYKLCKYFTTIEILKYVFYRILGVEFKNNYIYFFNSKYQVNYMLQLNDNLFYVEKKDNQIIVTKDNKKYINVNKFSLKNN